MFTRTEEAIRKCSPSLLYEYAADEGSRDERVECKAACLHNDKSSGCIFAFQTCTKKKSSPATIENHNQRWSASQREFASDSSWLESYQDRPSLLRCSGLPFQQHTWADPTSTALSVESVRVCIAVSEGARLALWMPRTTIMSNR